jgi:hypothetical protein
MKKPDLFFSTGPRSLEQAGKIPAECQRAKGAQVVTVRKGRKLLERAKVWRVGVSRQNDPIEREPDAESSTQS